MPGNDQTLEGSFPDHFTALCAAVNLMHSRIPYGVRFTDSGPRVVVQGRMDETAAEQIRQIFLGSGAVKVFAS